jgi:IS30 family transposase
MGRCSCYATRPSGPTAWNPSPARLSLHKREEIRVGLERGDTLTAIAQRIGRAVSTLSREVKANGGRDAYRAHGAHQAAFERARRPKTPKLACPRRAGKVAEWLVLLLHLPDGLEAIKVNEAMKTAIGDLAAELVRTITWDQGREMASHLDFSTRASRCASATLTARGSAARTRTPTACCVSICPKGTDLSEHSAEELAEIARSLNNRPRKSLGFMKPSEKLAEVLALTG